MNKLAAVQNAIEEVNKQAMFGVLRSVASKARSLFKPPKIPTPPVVSAGGAATKAQRGGFIKSTVLPIGGFMGMNAAFGNGVKSNLSAAP